MDTSIIFYPFLVTRFSNLLLSMGTARHAAAILRVLRHGLFPASTALLRLQSYVCQDTVFFRNSSRLTECCTMTTVPAHRVLRCRFGWSTTIRYISGPKMIRDRHPVRRAESTPYSPLLTVAVPFDGAVVTVVTLQRSDYPRATVVLRLIARPYYGTVFLLTRTVAPTPSLAPLAYVI